LIFLLLIPFKCLGQHTVISATKMNVLYTGLKNPVSFAVESMECNELEMVVENGSAERTGDCDYEVIVARPGYAFIFIIKGEDTIGKARYRVRNMPDPIIDRNNDGPYWLQLDSLRTQTGLTATMERHEVGHDFKFSIVSFDITVMRDKKLSDEKKIYCAECIKKIEDKYYEAVFSSVNKGSNFNAQL